MRMERSNSAVYRPERPQEDSEGDLKPAVDAKDCEKWQQDLHAMGCHATLRNLRQRRQGQALMQPLATHQLGELGRIRALNDAFLGHDHVNKISRGDIEHRVESLNICTYSLAPHIQ